MVFFISHTAVSPLAISRFIMVTTAIYKEVNDFHIISSADFSKFQIPYIQLPTDITML